MIYVLHETVLAISSSVTLSLMMKATVISATALVATRVARHCRASFRHLLLATSFIVLLVLPVASIVAPPRDVRIAMSQPDTLPVVSLPRGAAPVVGSPSAESESHATSSTPSWLRISTVFFWVWITGIALFLAPMIDGVKAAYRLRREGLPWRGGQAVIAEIAQGRTRERIQLLLHEAIVGPMTCGIIRPAIILPRDARTWQPDDLRRALVHEVEHIRRWDWLTMCLACAVCALYWFHPLMWISWRRLRLEAERACDDVAVREGQPEAYADQLVTLAERLASGRTHLLLAMASRSDLFARVSAVLDVRQPRGRAGSLRIAIVATTAAVLLLAIAPLRAVPLRQGTADVRAQVQPVTGGTPSFEVVSLKPNQQGFIDLGGGLRLLRGETRCHSADAAPIPGDPLPPAAPGRCAIRNSTVKEMIDVAYELRFGPVRAVLNQMVIGGPSWMETETFDVDAKAETPSVTLQQMHAMMRAMLAERFGLTFHREARQSTGLALVLAKNGHKLTPSDPSESVSFRAAPVVRGQNVPILSLANLLSQRLGRAVTDNTGLTGRYDFTLSWTPDPTEFGPDGRAVGGGLGDPGASGLTTALEEQLGLKLETRRVAIDAFVIDSIERPTPN